jgi:hypothetical protein
LDFCDWLDQDSGGEKGDADVHIPWMKCSVSRVNGRECEEKAVERIMDRVEGRDENSGNRGRLLFGGSEDPEDLSRGGGNRHEEEEGLKGGETYTKGGDERGGGEVPDRGRLGDANAKFGKGEGGYRCRNGSMPRRMTNSEVPRGEEPRVPRGRMSFCLSPMVIEDGGPAGGRYIVSTVNRVNVG